MSRVLDFFSDGFPVTLVFSKANGLKSATNVLTLPQGNGYVVPIEYNFHPLMLSVKTTDPTIEKLANNGFSTAGGGGADVFASWVETAGNGAIAAETGAGNFHTGTTSAKLTTGADGLVKVAQDIVTIPGYSYTFTYWVKGDGVTNKSRYSIVDKTNTADIKANTSITTASAAYQQITVTFTAPTGCVLTTVNLIGSATAGAIAYFDDASVVVSAIPTHTAVFSLTSDGTVLDQPTTWMDDLTVENHDDAHVNWTPIGEGKEIKIQMVTTADYIPDTADIDAVLLGVLKHS